MLEYLILLLPVILPAVFWAAYHLHVDRLAIGRDAAGAVQA